MKYLIERRLLIRWVVVGSPYGSEDAARAAYDTLRAAHPEWVLRIVGVVAATHPDMPEAAEGDE